MGLYYPESRLYVFVVPRDVATITDALVAGLTWRRVGMRLEEVAPPPGLTRAYNIVARPCIRRNSISRGRRLFEALLLDEPRRNAAARTAEFLLGTVQISSLSSERTEVHLERKSWQEAGESGCLVNQKEIQRYWELFEAMALELYINYGSQGRLVVSPHEPFEKDLPILPMDIRVQGELEELIAFIEQEKYFGRLGGLRLHGPVRSRDVPRALVWWVCEIPPDHRSSIIATRHPAGGLRVIFGLQDPDLAPFMEAVGKLTRLMRAGGFTELPQEPEAEDRQGRSWQDVPAVGYDQKLLQLWHSDYTAAEIGARLGKSGHTIRNRLSELRRRYGDTVVPKRRSARRK